jgi:hypothetical protein
MIQTYLLIISSELSLSSNQFHFISSHLISSHLIIRCSFVVHLLRWSCGQAWSPSFSLPRTPATAQSPPFYPPQTPPSSHLTIPLFFPLSHTLAPLPTNTHRLRWQSLSTSSLTDSISLWNSGIHSRSFTETIPNQTFVPHELCRKRISGTTVAQTLQDNDNT